MLENYGGWFWKLKKYKERNGLFFSLPIYMHLCEPKSASARRLRLLPLLLVIMVHIAVVTSIAVVSSVAAASIVCFKMFCRCKMALLGRRRAEVDSELGPAQACIGGDSEKGAAALRRFQWLEIESLTARFAPSSVIGEGGSSIVYLARLPDSSFAAVKLHRPSERLRRAFRRELDVLRPLRHPHVVRLLGYCDDRGS